MGQTLQLHNEPFNTKKYPDAAFDLLSVKMDSSFTGKIKLAVNLNGPIEYIKRLEIDSCVGDGAHVGAACHDLVVEEGFVYVHDLPPGALHWDAIQFLGGYRIKFRNLVVIQRNPGYDTEGRCVFMSGGHDGVPDVEDVVFENCWLESHRDPISTKTQVFTQALSLRSGLRDCYIVEAQAGKNPIWQKTDAQSPVNTGNVIIPSSHPVPLHP